MIVTVTEVTIHWKLKKIVIKTVKDMYNYCKSDKHIVEIPGQSCFRVGEIFNYSITIANNTM